MAQPEIKIDMKRVIIPMYKKVFKAIMQHAYTTFVFAGGRGSTKSSFVAIMIVFLIVSFKGIHAVCFRKVGNTIQKSIFPQVTWAIYELGLQSFFHIPKSYATPIVYLPTGQEIIFMGLDDPNKVKSIKLPFGYIGITWFEELDQYSGREELRKVTQSTKRGGQLFWDFRTFNPPISKNNWANEYADEVEFDSTSTMVVRNNYLDVPANWLGQEFINDAEELKRKNERAYMHEYLGLAIGTGGDVFPNLCELDMSKSHDVLDAHGNVMYQTPLLSTFDNVFNGLDWGFAIDPCAFNKMYFDKAHLDLYIYAEYHTIKKRNQEIFDELYGDLGLMKKEELLTADSAEPKSVADFKSYGAFIRGAEKGPDSVRYSIRWFQGLNHIYVDRHRCPETWKEFSQYEYEQDRDGNFISAFPDENNHHIDACRYAMESHWKRKGN